MTQFFYPDAIERELTELRFGAASVHYSIRSSDMFCFGIIRGGHIKQKVVLCQFVWPLQNFVHARAAAPLLVVALFIPMMRPQPRKCAQLKKLLYGIRRTSVFTKRLPSPAMLNASVAW